MVSGRPRVLTPIAPIAAGGGVTLLLISLEVWPEEVVAHLAGEPDPTTGRVEVDTTFSDPWQRWEREMLEPTVARRKPPESAMDQLFGLRHASEHLSDDLGTCYQFKAGHTGGTGTEWRADWYFTPGVPDEASALTLALAGENISSTPITLALR